jgi:predicted nucleotidyltransferase
MKTSSYESILTELLPKPLQERRDYGVNGRDFLEQNAVELMSQEEMLGKIKLPMELELQLMKRLKKSSLIDYPKESLCHCIWDSTKQPPVLKTEIRQKILSELFKVLKKDWLTEVTLVGSITTNQYVCSSDVDVNVCIDYNLFRKSNPVLTKPISDDLELRKLIRNKVHKINGFNVIGEHEVHYHITEKGKRLESEFVFDLLNDKWIKEPVLVDIDLDPDKQYEEQKEKALGIVSSVVSCLLQTKVDIVDFLRQKNAEKDTIESKRNISIDIEKLKHFKDNLKQLRQIDNVVFKYVEKYGFKKPLEVLKVLLNNEEKKVLEELGLIKQAVIKRCPKKNLTDDRPISEQQWCLFDSKGERLLGRHPTKEKALAQERVIQIHKHMK